MCCCVCFLDDVVVTLWSSSLPFPPSLAPSPTSLRRFRMSDHPGLAQMLCCGLQVRALDVQHPRVDRLWEPRHADSERGPPARPLLLRL